MRRLMALVLVALGCVLVTAAPAQACEVTPKRPQAQLQDADYVFSGKVVQSATSGRQATYTVDVRMIYKGEIDSHEVTVTSPTDTARCGLSRIREGRQYMFFAASRKNGVIDARSFQGTRELDPGTVRLVEQVYDGQAPPRATGQDQPTGATTVLDDSEAPSVTSAILPGLILVAVGLVVLLGTRMLGRRSEV